MSSWTADPEIAKAYAPPGGILLRAEIPISQVLSTAFSGGMGTYVEREVVLLGSPEKIMGVVGSEHKKLTNLDSDTAGVIDVVDKPKDSGVEKAILDSLPTKKTATEPQAIAVAKYTRQVHDSINNYLRYIGGNKKVSNPIIDYSSFDGGKYVLNKWSDNEFAYTLDEVLEYIESLDALIEQGPGIVEDTTLYRYLQDWMLSEQLLKTLKPGDEMEDKGFISTSRGNFKPSDSSNLKMIINVPKGTKGLYVDWFKEGSFSDSGEQEVILPRGTKFVVTKIEDNQVYVDIKESIKGDTDTPGIIDVVSEEATKDRLDPSLQKFSERTVAFTEDGRSQVKMLRIAVELGEDSAYIDWEPSGELYYIKVPPEYRRQGIATRLWEAAKEHARKFGLPIPTHSQYRTDEGDAWAKSLDEELPPRIQS
jgi:GNAT superfamily N-acetyltransferase